MKTYDIIYVNQIAPYLDLFREVGTNKWNFRCPLCGDSKKNKKKSRGYFFDAGDTIMFKCQNCGEAMPFGAFLKRVNTDIYNKWVFDQFRESNNINQVLFEDEKIINPKYTLYNISSKLTKISSLYLSHPAYKYIRERKIPTREHYKLFWCPNFKHFVNTFIPNKFDEHSLKYEEGRIIIPFLTKTNELIGFQGRSLNPKSYSKYITIKLNDDYPKVWGLERYDSNKYSFILEGAFDAMFFENSMAFCGLDFDNIEKFVDTSNTSLILDNEPRSIYVVSHMKEAIKKGLNVFFWPSNIDQKDINNLTTSGQAPQDMVQWVKDHTKHGLEAELELSNWRKC